ncbi:MAG: AAA family ATPase [Cyanobacteria bacterium P01_H01_bin.74]
MSKSEFNTQSSSAATKNFSGSTDNKADTAINQPFNNESKTLQAKSTQDLKRFVPVVPREFAALNVDNVIVEDIIFKTLLAQGALTGRELAKKTGLNFPIIESLLADLKTRLFVAHQSNSGVGDFIYRLTDLGHEKAIAARDISAYTGTIPVSFNDYLEAMKQQSIRNEKPNRAMLEKAFDGLIFDETLFDTIGPAVNSGRGLFLFGEPGNGKTTIAERLSQCFRGSIFIPKALWVEGQILQLYDPQNHEPVHKNNEKEPLISQYDPRWIEIKRPAVMVGGELTLEALEVNYNSILRVSEAPLQMKANGGIFLIDDFGRQRMSHVDLLNRWIVPLEKQIDFLTLPNGQKIAVPFDELIIFSTNLDPNSLVDDAFLRRIPYKINVKDPSEGQFVAIFKLLCSKFNIDYQPDVVEYLLEQYYRNQRPFRGCQPRDILLQVINSADYMGESQPKLTCAVIDMACRNYFAAMGKL